MRKINKIRKTAAVGLTFALISSFGLTAYASETETHNGREEEQLEESAEDGTDRETAGEPSETPEETPGVQQEDQVTEETGDKEEEPSGTVSSDSSAEEGPAEEASAPENEAGSAVSENAEPEHAENESSESVSSDTVPEALQETPSDTVSENGTAQEDSSTVSDPSVDDGDRIVLYDFGGEDPESSSLSENVVVVSVDRVDFIDGVLEESKVKRSGLSFDLTDSFDLATADTPAPSLDDGTWEDYGLYYDYNYDTSSAAQWGAWGGNAHLTGQKYPDTNNNDISHAFGLYTDGENVKLYISYAGMFYAAGNGNDYNFMFNGSGYNGSESAKFRVVLEDGTDLSSARLAPGTYDLKIYHGDHAMSGNVADAYGTILIKPDNAYNEMEITIPISTMKEQNPDINTDIIQNIAFTSPNLMRGQVECAGASTSPGLGAVLALVMSGLGASLGTGRFRLPI